MGSWPSLCLRLLGALNGGLVAMLLAAGLTRVPGVLGETLGVLSPRFGDAVLAAGGAAALVLALARTRAPWILAPVLFMVVVHATGIDFAVTRRRSVLMAAGVALAAALAARWTRCASPRRGALLSTITALVAAAGLAGLAHLDARPYRTRLPSIPHERAPSGAPTIVLITLDTTIDGVQRRSEWFPHAGALDRFRRSAVEFTDVSSEASHTHPAMASLVTSRWPLEHGSVSTSPDVDPALPTLARHLRAHGYRTAGFLENPWLSPSFGLAQGYEFLDRSARLKRIEAWLDEDDPRPAFLHVHLFEPHGPYELRAWALEELGLPRRRAAEARLGQRIDADFIRAGETPGIHNLSTDDFAWLKTIYLTEIVAMDRWLGRFLEALETRDPGGAHTVTLITADHGEEFGEHGALHHSHTLFDELVRVPFLLRAPGLAPGISDAPAGLIDVAPTLLDLAGLPPLPGASGSSLVQATGSSVAQPLVSTRFFKDDHHLVALRLGEWKLHVKAPVSSTTSEDPLGLHSKDLAQSAELYHLPSDPAERQNVAGAHPELVKELSELARSWQSENLRKMAQEGRAMGWARSGSQIEVDPRTAEELRGFGYSLDASDR